MLCSQRSPQIWSLLLQLWYVHYIQNYFYCQPQLRYLVCPDYQFMAIGTTSKIDWVATCFGYRSLITMNRETPGIISLLEKLNSRLLRGQQYVPSPILESRHPIPLDSTMQSAIGKLQSRVPLSSIQNFVHTPGLTPTRYIDNPLSLSYHSLLF